MLSIVVSFFNNRREAANTLHSLSRDYQRDVDLIKYEVLVADNGSAQPLSEAHVMSFGPEFHYHYVETQSASPAITINALCRRAAGDELLVIIDGAHILSPGVLRAADEAFRLFPSPFIATLPFHLGPKLQNQSVVDGYNQQMEDELLGQSGWKSNGYRLFTIAGSFADGNDGWFGCLYESGCFAIRKVDYFGMGGFDARFQSRGGGLVNLDFFRRALANPQLQYVMLLGEGTFHQFHGGVASSAPVVGNPWDQFEAEYVRIRGMRYQRHPRRPYFLGALPKECLSIARNSAQKGLDFWRQIEAAMEIDARRKGG